MDEPLAQVFDSRGDCLSYLLGSPAQQDEVGCDPLRRSPHWRSYMDQLAWRQRAARILEQGRHARIVEISFGQRPAEEFGDEFVALARRQERKRGADVQKAAYRQIDRARDADQLVCRPGDVIHQQPKDAVSGRRGPLHRDEGPRRRVVD
jgi:hypothetical protein